jgi:thymidylate synthase (FAD)
MRTVKPVANIVFPSSQTVADEMLLNIEAAARTCYKAEGNMGVKYNGQFIRDKIDRGHLSVIEHSMATVRFVVDRGVSHELVRHRIASFSQESTRYCNYSKEKFGGEIAVINLNRGIDLCPVTSKLSAEQINAIYWEWCKAMNDAELHYLKMLELGASPQIARSVLPNSLKTELLLTANLREWRHFFTLRTSTAAHPQMREVTVPLLADFQRVFPPIFEDIDSGKL